MTDHLRKLVKTYDKLGGVAEWVREPTKQEWDYINNERILCKYDYRYFVNRYCYIRIVRPDGSPVAVDRLGKYGFMRTQEALLKRIEDDEEAMYDSYSRGESISGLLYFVHKARQTGFTALIRTMDKQRTFFWPDTMALAASENLEMVQELYRRDKVLWDSMPWFVRPTIRYDTKDQQLEFAGINTVTLYHQGNQKGGLGTGKGQPVNARVVVPEGWKRFGDLQLGDRISGRDGKFHKITGIFPRGLQKTYKLSFSDGSFLVCDEDHLWTLETCKRSRGDREQTWSVKDLLNRPIKTTNGARRFYLPLSAPTQFPKKELPLHPYLLGVLLGDGSISQKSVSFSAEDDFSFAAEYLPAGSKLSSTRYGASCPIWRITTPGQRTNDVKSALFALGLMGTKSRTKFIPDMYLFSCVDDRVALLQGLMDTDGSASGGNCHLEFGTSSRYLVSDVTTLVQSLGGTARQVYRESTDSFRLYISLPNDIPPFKLERKKASYRKRTKYYPRRGLDSIEYAGEQETICISVDSPDNLYVTENFVVTHNTITVAHLTECALWDRSAANHYDNTKKILEDLYPAIPKALNTLYFMESTAMGIGGFWYDQVELIRAGSSRFKLFFCPWYAADEKYAETPPIGWAPNDFVVHVAETVEQTSKEYMGYQMKLNRNQMYWYERTMEEHTGRLFTFFSNYPTTIEESFQNSGDCAFDYELLAELHKGIGPFHGAYDLTSIL